MGPTVMSATKAEGREGRWTQRPSCIRRKEARVAPSAQRSMCHGQTARSAVRTSVAPKIIRKSFQEKGPFRIAGRASGLAGIVSPSAPAATSLSMRAGKSVAQPTKVGATRVSESLRQNLHRGAQYKSYKGHLSAAMHSRIDCGADSGGRQAFANGKWQKGPGEPLERWKSH